MAAGGGLPAIRALCAGARPVSRDEEAALGGGEARGCGRGAAYVLRVGGGAVALVHRGTGVEERRFAFPERVLDAVSADFPSSSGDMGDGDGAETKAGAARHLCVLVRPDCVNIYAPSGDVYEVALPFQASRVFPMTDASGRGMGLLLQRSSVSVALSTPAKRPVQGNGGTTGNSSSYSDHRYVLASTSSAAHVGKTEDAASAFATPLLSRPRFFTLSHPLDEVKPIALGAPNDKAGRPTTHLMQANARDRTPAFLSDPALVVVSLISELSLLVAFHEDEQRFCAFRLEKLSPGRQQRADRKVLNVEIVDGPAWTAFRQHMEFQEHRIVIEPEWVVHEVWRSPSLSNNLASTPVKPAAISTRMPTNPQRRAFLASHADRSQVLCLVDKRAGVLMLQPVSLRAEPSRGTQQQAIAFDEQERPAIVQCSDAVAIRLDDQSGLRDIVVLQADGALALYRSSHALCRIELAWSCDAYSARSRLRSLLATEDSDSFETVMTRVSDQIPVTKVWRWEHPLKFAYSPLLSAAIDVIDYALPPIAAGKLRVEVARRAQAKLLQTDLHTQLGGFEWSAWVDLLTELAEASSQGGTSDVEMTLMTAASASRHASAFDVLCQSEYHAFYWHEHGVELGSLVLPPAMAPPQLPVDLGNDEVAASESPLGDLQEHSATIFAVLHLLHEDYRLSQTSSSSQLQLADVLKRMAEKFGLQNYLEYYRGESCIQGQSGHRVDDGTHLRARSPITAVRSELCPWLSHDIAVPDILQWIQCRVTSGSGDDPHFPVISWDMPHSPCALKGETPLQRTRAVCGVYDILFPVDHHPHQFDGNHTHQRRWMDAMSLLSQEISRGALSLGDLPVGVAYPIVDVIRAVKQNPPPFIGEEICSLIGRPDLAGVAVRSTGEPGGGVGHTSQRDSRENRDESAPGSSESHERDVPDGLDEVVAATQPMFPRDQRVKEVARLLRSNRPICLKLEKAPDTSDQDYVQQQQARLLLLCKRTMSLSVARGMVTLGNFDVNLVQTQAWQLRVPSMPLAGRTPPTNAIVSLDVSGYAKELTYWPQFHNGCATGLRLPATDLSRLINRHWIKYHRPTVTDSGPLQIQRHATRVNNRPHLPAAEAKKQNLEEEYAAHAGLLLGIGLRGHLKCLSMADVYNYLSLSNEYVTVSILLGMATTAAHSHQQRVRGAKSPSTSQSQAEKETAEAASPIPPPASGGDDDGLEGSDNLQGSVDEDLSFLSSRGVGSGKPRALGGMGLELTLERSVSKMLCLHVPSLLPAPFAEFSVPASTQTAALLGLGILYQATGYRLMAELLLAEIARSPSSSQFVSNHSSGNSGLSTTSFDQLEGYSLAAGLALGLVLLGRGRATTGDPGLADLNLEERLHKYVVGGSQLQRDANAAGSCLHRGRRWKSFGNVADDGESSAAGGNSSRASSNSAPRAGGHDSKYSSSDRASSQAEHVNIGVTAPGSALALAFMYMQSGNKSVASQLAVPDTLILLDYVRPDILLVRTLARNLVLWDGISPSESWIEKRQVPEQLLQAYTRLRQHQQSREGDNWQDQLPPNADLRSICESYANIVAGACFSIGLRFAGTSNTAARGTLRKFVLHFRELRTKSPTSSIGLHSSNGNIIAAATERPTIERCLAICALALAMVDAGTGHVETLTLLRALNLRQRVDIETTYGSHMALSMALGLLFLGGGRATLARSKEAIAALVVSLYPMMPLNTADNKYHLQAFRHLYVLAVDTSRHVETVDASLHASCSVPIQVELKPSTVTPGSSMNEPTVLELHSPCLMPEFGSIRRISIESPQYYPVEIALDVAASSTELPTSSQGAGSSMDRTANAMRAALLRDKSVIMLKRRKVAVDPIDRLGGSQSAARSVSYDLDDRLVHLWQQYASFKGNGEEEGNDDDEDDEDGGSTKAASPVRHRRRWWAPHLQPAQVDWLRDDAQMLLPLHLNSLLALFRLTHGPRHLTSASDLWSLRLLSGFKTHAQDHTSSSGDDCNDTENGVWLQQQTDLALRRLWLRSGQSISSVASARLQLLGTTPAPPSGVDAERNAFLVQALVRYLAGSTWRTLARGWRPRLRLALSSHTDADADAGHLPPFDLRAFLAADAVTLSTEEKTFWLRLVSFFLFPA